MSRKIRSNFIKVVIKSITCFATCSWAALLIALIAGCSGEHQTARNRTPAEEIWMKVESPYRTNSLPTAYALTREARNTLTAMRARGEGGLSYPYCLAVLNGRLFTMATSLGKTNEAAEFLKDAAFYLNLNRQELRLQPTNFSAQAVESFVRGWDAKVHP
jgi:hypothetical protein